MTAPSASSPASSISPSYCPIPSHHVLLFTGGKFHDYDAAAESLSAAMKAIGARVTRANDGSAAASLAGGGYDCAVLYTQGEFFDAGQVEQLSAYVRAGGGLVALHGANSARGSEAYARLIGSTFRSHGPVMDFAVTISDADHPIAHRIQPFRITDELYVIDPKSDFRPFLTAWWDGKPQPIAYSKTEGSGRVVYLASGHDARAWDNATWRRLFARAVRYAAGEDWSGRTCKVAAIGYGAAFNMGRTHLESCNRARLKAIAVCDADINRHAVAKQELGEQIRTVSKIEDLLCDTDAEMCIVITPHNTHATLAIQCLESGRHVVTEKPFTITIDEASRVIDAGRQHKRMATVFHNRRWDGDFLALQKIIASGAIGDVYHIDCGYGNLSEPNAGWWRSYKPISGGAMYDWGAHFIDWTLRMLPHRIESVSGDFKKLKWHQVSIEDYTSAYIRFEGGRSASMEQGSVCAIPRSRWRILGTLGAIEQRGWDQKEGLRVVSYASGAKVESTVPIGPSDWDGFYRNIADHLLLGEALEVTPEQARDVIAVIRLAEQSSQQGGTPMRLPYEDEQ